MAEPMETFATAFQPLAECGRTNAPFDAVRPYIKPVQNAIHQLSQPSLDRAFQMMADLTDLAPLPSAGWASLLCGVFVENGGTIGIGAGAIIKAGRQAFRAAVRQHEATWSAWREAEQAKGGQLTPGEAQAVSAQASQGFSETERNTLAILPFFADPLCAIMERSKEVRKSVRQDADFCRDILALRGQGNDSPALLSKLVMILDDVELLALDPATRQGYFFKIAGICHNFQLHTLLADALIGDPTRGLLPGTRPDPTVVAMAKDQPFDRNAPPGTASFHLQTWHAIRPDGSHDTGAMSHVLWHEGTPADIPDVEGMRIVLLSPVTLPRSWRAPRDWTEMVGELEVTQHMSSEQVGAIVKMLAERPRENGPEESSDSGQ